MKKRMLFCLAVLGAASMLFGFDSAETPESLMEKMQQASAEAGAAEVDMDMNMDVSVDISDGTTTSSIGIGASGSFDVTANVDPVAVSMDGTLNMSLFGQSQSMIMKLYGVTSDDGTYNTYVYTEDSASGEPGTWEHGTSSMPALDMAELQEQAANIDYSEWGINFELAPEASMVDGAECYLLSTVIDSSSLETMLNKIEEMTGEDVESDEDVALAMSMLNGIELNIEYYVDSATYLPVKLHMDLNGSDLSALSQYLAMSMGEMAEGSSVELVLNDISVDAAVAYSDSVEITVPDEALSAAESSDVSGDVIGEVENVLGGAAN